MMIDHSKKTIPAFPSTDIPHWARFFAVDSTGKGYWYEAEPKKMSSVWNPGPARMKRATGTFSTDGWEESLAIVQDQSPVTAPIDWEERP